MAERLSWGSNHPGHLVYLLDLSGSMEHNGKIDHLLEAVKATIDLLIAKDMHKNRFSVSIIGYNTDTYSLFKGTALDLDRKLDEVYNNGGENAPLFDKTKEAKPQWQTYTAKAFRAVKEDIQAWIREQQQGNIPMPVPIVIHVTDGYPYENERGEAEACKDAIRAADEIKQITLPDGNPIIFNIHIGDSNDPESLFPMQRPSDAGQQFLFDSSSVMPDDIVNVGRDAFCFPTQQGCRYMASNVREKGKLAQLITFGSTPVANMQVEQPKP